MLFESFGGLDIFCPRPHIEFEIRLASEAHLRTKFNVGKYTSKDEINAIVQHQFKFYEKLLEELLPLVASLDFLEVVLHEYEIASQIMELHKQGKLRSAEAKRWEQIGLIFRRAAKYLAERILLFQPNKSPKAGKNLLLPIAEKVWICVEEMVEAYVVSDQTYLIFPEETVLKIFPHGEEKVYHQGLLRELPDMSRIRFDTQHRHKFIPEPSFIFDIEEHNKIIGNAVRESIGVTYFDAIKILGTIIDGCIPAPDGFQIPFVVKGELIEKTSQLLGFSSDAVEKVISGFSVSKKQMDSEGRKVWKPKQEYRAYRRAFFECSHPAGQHVTFSKSMAEECLIFLVKDVIFKKLPKEWLNSSVNTALSHLSNEAGKWFEAIVESNIRACGFDGVKSTKAIGNKEKRVRIPSDIGEIDYIGYSQKEKILLVAECKLVRDSFEPKFFQDDISEFITAKKSYIKKFRKKVNWVKENINSISQALESTNGFKESIAPEKVVGVIITYIPTFASYFIEDYPCVSLTEFMLDYGVSNKYSYENGVSYIN